jgi:hypothetical protein
MTFNLYSANHKVWDHVGNITPNVEYSEAHRPHGEYIVADWLPVGRYDKHYENYFVVSSGKIIAFDKTGRVVPAGLKTAFAVTSGDVLTYAAADVTELTTDLTTGVAVAAAAGYTRTEIGTALLGLGLIDAGEAAEDFISFPVGVAPYNFIQWAGGDGFNPAQYKQNNFNMQHRVAILCKYVVEMPLVPAEHAGSDLASATAISDSAIADWTDAEANGAWFSATSLSLTLRYASDVSIGDDVVALNLPVMDLAQNVVLTPIVLPTGFTREVPSLAEIVQAGDYFIDYAVGVILIFETDGNAAAVASGTATYFHYEALPATVSTYACALGDLRPGDFVRADGNSNFVKAQIIIDTDVEVVTSEDPETSLSSDELAGLLNLCAKRQDEIIGQVLDSDIHPKDYMERVRTAWPDLGTLDQMPGSASAGLPAQLTYAGGSNTMIRILLLK